MMLRPKEEANPSGGTADRSRVTASNRVEGHIKNPKETVCGYGGTIKTWIFKKATQRAAP